MAKCIKIRRKHRKVCIADLDTLGQVFDRNIVGPINSDVDFTENFSNSTDTWMLVNTVKGETFFDEINEIENTVTHHIYIAYEEGFTAEKWIDIETQRFDVLDVEDLDLRHEWQLLRCTNRGLATKEASDA